MEVKGWVALSPRGDTTALWEAMAPPCPGPAMPAALSPSWSQPHGWPFLRLQSGAPAREAVWGAGRGPALLSQPSQAPQPCCLRALLIHSELTGSLPGARGPSRSGHSAGNRQAAPQVLFWNEAGLRGS